MKLQQAESIPGCERHLEDSEVGEEALGLHLGKLRAGGLRRLGGGLARQRRRVRAHRQPCAPTGQNVCGHFIVC